MGQGSVEDDDEAPFRVVSGGGSDLARISCSLRHDTAYKPHEVRPNTGTGSSNIPKVDLRGDIPPTQQLSP